MPSGLANTCRVPVRSPATSTRRPDASAAPSASGSVCYGPAAAGSTGPPTGGTATAGQSSPDTNAATTRTGSPRPAPPAALCAAMDEERVGAWEELVEIELRLGHHARIVGEIRDLAGRHPLRERIAGQYMTALHRGGRRADALAHYRDVRERFATELGIDPSPALGELHQRILRDDPDLAAPVPAEPTVRHPVPRQLPADTTHFTGRDPELDHLLSRHAEYAGRSGPARTVVISAIDGMANTARWPRYGPGSAASPPP